MQISLESGSTISNGLSELLRTEGNRMPDRFEIKKYHPILGQIKLNDYWNGFHKAYDGKHGADRDLDSFYEEGNTPVIGMWAEDVELSAHIFRPADISLQGIGYILLNKLPETHKTSEEILIVTNACIVPTPLVDHDITTMIEIVTASA